MIVRTMPRGPGLTQAAMLIAVVMLLIETDAGTPAAASGAVRLSAPPSAPAAVQ